MTEWTSISVTEEQKQTLKDAKPDGVAMGAFLVDLLNGDTTDTDAMQVVPVEEVVGRDVPTESVRSGPVELEATEYRKIADEVAGRLR